MGELKLVIFLCDLLTVEAPDFVIYEVPGAGFGLKAAMRNRLKLTELDKRNDLVGGLIHAYTLYLLLHSHTATPCLSI